MILMWTDARRGTYCCNMLIELSVVGSVSVVGTKLSGLCLLACCLLCTRCRYFCF